MDLLLRLGFQALSRTTGASARPIGPRVLGIEMQRRRRAWSSPRCRHRRSRSRPAGDVRIEPGQLLRQPHRRRRTASGTRHRRLRSHAGGDTIRTFGADEPNRVGVAPNDLDQPRDAMVRGRPRLPAIHGFMSLAPSKHDDQVERRVGRRAIVGRMRAPLRSAVGEMVVIGGGAAVQPFGDDAHTVAEFRLQHARPAVLVGVARAVCVVAPGQDRRSKNGLSCRRPICRRQQEGAACPVALQPPSRKG